MKHKLLQNYFNFVRIKYLVHVSDKIYAGIVLENYFGTRNWYKFETDFKSRYDIINYRSRRNYQQMWYRNFITRQCVGAVTLKQECEGAVARVR